MRIHFLSTSFNPESKSRALMLDVAAMTAAQGPSVGFTDIRDLPPAFCDGSDLIDYPSEYSALGKELACANAVVLGAPIYSFAISGGTKNLLDIIGPALRDRVVGIITAAGSQRSHLAVGPLIVSLTMDYGMHVHPETLQITNPHASKNHDWKRRVETFVIGLVDHTRRMSQTADRCQSQNEPRTRRETPIPMPQTIPNNTSVT